MVPSPSMRTEGGGERSSSAIATIPNAISAMRILLIPLFVWFILRDGTEAAGIVLFAAVAATDWVDGTIARRTGRVSELGKILDPVADRLAIAAGLVALVIADLFPPWAALLILVRDAAVLAGGAFALARRRVRIDVRFIGKVATFGLMVAVPSISWGRLDLPLAPTATALGWIIFAVSIVEYYIAAAMYAGDLRRALAGGGTLGADGR
jgi:cardiolipin synthase (CMP-forming)